MTDIRSSDRLRRVATLSALVLCCGTPVLAQAQLIADINRTPHNTSAGSSPGDFVEVGGQLLFMTSEFNHGPRLWRSDGTIAGTVPVFSMPPSQWFTPQLNYAATVGNVLYFRAQTLDHGSELWRTDGTTAGTYILKDIVPGSGSSSPNNFAVLGSSVYFSAETPAHGIELWRTDGTTAGTMLVKDILPGSAHSRPFFLHRFGNRIVFSALARLWITDGTSSGTVQLNSVVTYPNGFTTLGNVVLFSANGPLGTELWRTDGTVAGTVQVKDIRPGTAHSGPNQLAAAGGRVYFSADDGVHGMELWSSDGTAAGTTLVSDIRPGPGGSAPQEIKALRGGIVFAADRSATTQPWFSDGTALGTVRLTTALFEPHRFTIVPATPSFAVFRAQDSQGREMWRTDGTPAGTHQVADIHPTGDALHKYRNYYVGVLGTQVFFAADDGQAGQEVWTSDGTRAGTRLFKDIYIRAPSSQPLPGIEINGKLLFSADDGLNGRTLWASDGTPNGTQKLAFRLPLISPFSVRLGRFLYFLALKDFTTSDLWRTDGSPAGTSRVHAANTSLFNAAPLVRAGNLIFYTIANELWATDGPPTGARVVFTFTSTSPYAGPANLTAFQGKIWLTAEHRGLQSMWTSDGTTAGTQRFASLGRTQLELTVAGNRMFFYNEGVTTGGELWATDGTVAGTGIVRDIVPGASSSFPKQLTAVQNRLFFVAGYDREVWVSDGTAGGTNQVRNIHPTRTSNPQALTALGNRLLFHAENPTSGREPWISDGTFAGTTMLGDLRPGPDSSMSDGSPTSTDTFTRVGSERIAMFRAQDGTHGYEPWRTDGTAAGTFLAADVATGHMSSSPAWFAMGSKTVLFAAKDEIVGEELFGIRLIDLRDSLASPIGFGCTGTNGKTPKLTPVGLPIIGNANFGLQVTDALPQAPALLSIGVDIARFDFGSTCFTLNATPLVFFGLATSGTGTAHISVPIPSTSTRGSSSVWEVLVLDSQGKMLNIASLTNALLLMGGD